MLKKAKLLDYFTSVLFILPNFLGFVAFTLGPLVASFILSFTSWDILTPARFVGFENFVQLLGFHREGGAWRPNDFYFWYALWNTLFLMFFIPVGMGLSLILALLFNWKIKGVVIFRTIYFLPTICSGVAVAILWRWLYNPDFGLINHMLHGVGIEGPAWLGSITWSKPALAFMGLWAGIGGFNCILYLAALQGVPQDLYDAAAVDGANFWQKFRYITWPAISPTTFFIFIMALIGGFQGGFMQAFMMTGGGPAFSTTTIDFFIYNNAYVWFKMGYASSIAWVLFILIFVVTLINWKYGQRVVQYI